jgi:hypothetical protein
VIEGQGARNGSLYYGVDSSTMVIYSNLGGVLWRSVFVLVIIWYLFYWFWMSFGWVLPLIELSIILCVLDCQISRLSPFQIAGSDFL